MPLDSQASSSQTFMESRIVGTHFLLSAEPVPKGQFDERQPGIEPYAPSVQVRWAVALAWDEGPGRVNRFRSTTDPEGSAPRHPSSSRRF